MATPIVPLAKVPIWQDIPDWGGKTSCPLLKMPGEVLDRCFNPDHNFHPRDWVSLAGVNSYFRTQLDNEVFEAVMVSLEEDEEEVSLTDLASPAYHIFTRQHPSSADPRPQPPAKLPFRPPPGLRSSWTRTQYAAYEEARRYYTILEKKKRADRAEKASLKAISDAANISRPAKRIRVGKTMRTVYMSVAGRKDGEPAVKKNAMGMPIGELEAAAKARVERDKQRIARVKARAKARREEAEATRLGMAELAGDGDDDDCVVPGMDGEDDLGAEKVPRFDEDGDEISARWANPARARMAAKVNDTWINQTNAIKVFAVTRELLLGLRHALIRNPQNARQPQQMFLRAAVGSLALRAHGGIAGYMERARKKEQTSQKRRATTQAKADQAIAEGRPPPEKKPRKALPSAAEAKARNDMANFDFDAGDYKSDESDGFGKGGCDECMELWVFGEGPPGGRCNHAGPSGSGS